MSRKYVVCSSQQLLTALCSEVLRWRLSECRGPSDFKKASLARVNTEFPLLLLLGETTLSATREVSVS
jgi:hypothetical protein